MMKRVLLTLSLLLFITSNSTGTDITYSNKSTGDLFTAGDANEVKAAVNSKEDSLGNPSEDGQILSSTTGGTRSWINPSDGGDDQTASEVSTTDEFSNSDSGNVQDVLDDLDAAIETNNSKISFDSTSSSKLSGIAEGAEVNVQSDWDASSGDSYIANKPSLVEELDDLSDITGYGTLNYALFDDGDGTYSFRAVTGTFPGFTDLPTDYSFDPDTKVDVSNITGVWADLNAVVIIDTTEDEDGRNLVIPELAVTDADAGLHLPTLADVDRLRRPIIISKSSSYTLGTDDTEECTNLVTVHVTGVATITACPYTAFVMPLTVVTRGNVAVSVKMNAADRMVLDGTALDDGDKATNTSSIGDTIYLEPESASGWFAWSGSNDGDLWTDGGQ